MTPLETLDIRTTCPRDCYDACGAVVRVAEGRIVHVRGDPDHPVSRGKLCRKCTLAYNGVFLDPQRRLTQPLVRTGPKGSGQFTPVSWDEASQRVAAKLTQLADTDSRRIIYSHYTGSFALLSYFYGMRLMRRLQATEVAPDTICNDAGHTALAYTYGTSLEGFDPRTSVDAACILVWGANPAATAPHQHSQWLAESPGSVVVVDPVRTETAVTADLHLQPFPGSDAVLAFGLMHVLARDGLIDNDFMGAHAVGGEELLALAAGWPPERAAEVTGVPAELIVRAAHAYGAGPALLWIGQGLQRQPRGGNIVRSVAALPALTGNLGRPGSGFLYLNGFGNRGIDEDYLAGADVYPQAPDPISHMDLTATLESPERAGAFVCWNVNPVGSCPEQGRMRRALEREDLFTVVLDLFATDTCDYADVILPAASWLECDDIVVPYFNRSLAAQVGAAPPMGESLPNSEIFRRIARRSATRTRRCSSRTPRSSSSCWSAAASGCPLPSWRPPARSTCRPTGPRSSSRTSAFPPPAAASSSPPRRRWTPVCRGCPSRSPTPDPLRAACVCSHPRRSGRSTRASPTSPGSRGWRVR